MNDNLPTKDQHNELLRMKADADRLAEQRRIEIRALQERVTAAQREAYEALDACRKANDEVGQRNTRIEALESECASLRAALAAVSR